MKGQAWGIFPLKSPFPGCGQERSTYKIAAVVPRGRQAESRASCSVSTSTVLLQTQLSESLSDLLLLPYLGNRIQMQIDLNPANPFNHVCECACVHAHVCEQTSHTYLYLYKFSLGRLNPPPPLPKFSNEEKCLFSQATFSIALVLFL